MKQERDIIKATAMSRATTSTWLQKHARAQRGIAFAELVAFVGWKQLGIHGNLMDAWLPFISTGKGICAICPLHPSAYCELPELLATAAPRSVQPASGRNRPSHNLAEFGPISVDIG